MLKALKAAHSAGWRAGFAQPRVMRPGGTRGITMIITPLNPYNNPFSARWRPVLALLWETGEFEGKRQSINQFLQQRRNRHA